MTGKYLYIFNAYNVQFIVYKISNMELKDVMIGDWIFPYNKDVPDKIYSLGYHEDMSGRWRTVSFNNDRHVHSYLSFCKAVPITPDILEKNGFKYMERYDGYLLSLIDEDGYGFIFVILLHVKSNPDNIILHIITDEDTDILIRLNGCNYVHQLQHALRLCNSHKDIIL